MDKLKQFYYDGWETVRTENNFTAVVIHDAFHDFSSFWNGFMSLKSRFNHVIVDTHRYQIFSDEKIAWSPCEHVKEACALGPHIASTDKWLVVGEWTGAQTDCAKWLNGKGRGARYDGTLKAGSLRHGNCQTKYKGTVDGLLDVDKTNLKYYVEAQLDAYEQRSGWIFWTWKTESAPEWHFRNLTKAGLITLTKRKYPDICQTSTCMIPGN